MRRIATFLLEGELALIGSDEAAALQWMAPAIQEIEAMGGGSWEVDENGNAQTPLWEWK